MTWTAQAIVSLLLSIVSIGNMAYGLRAWTAAGHYPGTLLSPRTEKHTVTTDRYGDRVETKQVADAVAGSAAERIVTDRFGDHMREMSIVDPISGRTHTSRVRSESPRGGRRHWEAAFADPLYRDRTGLTRAALDDPRVVLDDPLYRSRVLDDPLYRSRVLDDPLYRSRVVDDPLYRNRVIDDPLYRNRVIDDPLYRGRVADDPLYRSSVLEDPLYRSRVADPLYKDPLYRRSADPLYSEALLDRRAQLADPLYADPLYRRSALDDLSWRVSSRTLPVRDPVLARRSALLEDTMRNRELMYDLDNVTWSRSAFRNPLTGTLA